MSTLIAHIPNTSAASSALIKTSEERSRIPKIRCIIVKNEARPKRISESTVSMLPLIRTYLSERITDKTEGLSGFEFEALVAGTPAIAQLSQQNSNPEARG
jgi:hypothetical protein